MLPTENSPDLNSPWPRCAYADRIFTELFTKFLASAPLISELNERFLSTAGVRLQDIIDHWILPPDDVLAHQVAESGLEERKNIEGDIVWKHEKARLPALRFKSKRTTPCMAIEVQDIELFASQNSLDLSLKHGDAGSQYECAHLDLTVGELMVIARRGYAGYAPGSVSAEQMTMLEKAKTSFRTRSRDGEESRVIAEALLIFERVAAGIGRDRAVDEFFSAEREYYLSRNAAARWQYAQQQKIGIGWANHDHHTYRCSRDSFRAMLGLFHAMGFVSRERFYAGEEAGWGAQVLEHPVSRVVIFADLDLTSDELKIDFETAELTERDTLGTLGLWCALHGSSIAAAGMHHLEAEYDFGVVISLLKEAEFGVMPPFTDLPILKQAFTAAEVWAVAQHRLKPLLRNRVITPEQASQFQARGAPGSHLEILQRWEGFKGFNKTGVSSIILGTDARLVGGS